MDVSHSTYPYASVQDYEHQNTILVSWSKWLLSILLSLLVLTVTADASAKESTVNANDIRHDIENYRGQIQRLQQGIQKQQDKTEESTRAERNVLEELEELDFKLKAQQQKVNDLKVKTDFQQVLIDVKQGEIHMLQADRQKALNHLKNRSSAYYKMGKIGFLNVTFSSQSLPDLLKFHDSFQTLIAYDKEIILDYRHKIQDLERATHAHALELNLLQEFIATSLTEQQKTDQIRAEKEQLLTHVRTQKHLHQQAAAEMEKASEDLSKTILSLKDKEQSQEQTFARRKGWLRAPVKGNVITYFNQEKTNKLGVLRKSSGIAIQAPDGSKVQAVADGTVLFSGYLRGYGNTVIIHHGYQYYTVTSRLEKDLPKEGRVIKSGASIGQVSDIASLIDEGLYFEIRHGKESLDPMKWLDKRKLQIADPLPVFN